MYSIEEFDKEKIRVLKYIMYKKRTENEVRTKFQPTIEEDLLDDIIEYLKEAKYIDDSEYMEKTINNFKILITWINNLIKSTKFFITFRKKKFKFFTAKDTFTFRGISFQIAGWRSRNSLQD